MKAFLWSVLACVVIAFSAGLILTGMEDQPDDKRVTNSVRLN